MSYNGGRVIPSSVSSFSNYLLWNSWDNPNIAKITLLAMLLFRYVIGKRAEDKLRIYNQDRIKLLIAAFAVSVSACRPVLTVGWGEILIVAAVLLLVLVPLGIRTLRFMADNQKDKKDQGKE